MKQQQHICDPSKQTTHLSPCATIGISYSFNAQLNTTNQNLSPSGWQILIKSCLDCWNGRLNTWSWTYNETTLNICTQPHTHQTESIREAASLSWRETTSRPEPDLPSDPLALSECSFSWTWPHQGRVDRAHTEDVAPNCFPLQLRCMPALFLTALSLPVSKGSLTIATHHKRNCGYSD